MATVTVGLAVFALGTATFNLWIFWMRPREPAHLWLGVASIGVVWLSAGLASSYSAQTLEEAQSSLMLALGGALPLVAGFIRFSELFAGIQHPLLRAGIGHAVLLTALVFAAPQHFFDGTSREIVSPFGTRHVYAGLSLAADVMYGGFALIIGAIVAAYVRRTRRIPQGRSIALAIGVWAVCILNDMCVALGLYWAPWLLPIGFVAFSGTFGALLLERLVRSKQQVEHSTGELRGLIEARTDELRRKDLELAHGARLATLGALAGGIAHEVERPLVQIAENVKELRSAWRDETRPGAFDALIARSQRNVEHIRSVVAELLQLARRGEGRGGLHDLPTVVAGVLPIAGYELRRRARLETHLASTPAIRGDAAMLSQIALNLLVGAIHAFPEAPNAASARIDLTTETREEQACLVVSDNVPAPPGEAASDLFELGAVSDSERERHLQLAVTKQLVLRHGGSLTIDRGLHGTRVVVAFPAAEADGGGA